ncbi:DUF2934 domain-containing protein [Pseudomonas helleri]|uniref:DUF2934 domain-containing protein n=1 Tax=Pseudomonas helleri TaxID=1608996 RepID=A0A6A7YZ82_9PSED|nr:DUF2934 domain-containing protein [Pseudomonas helleri]MQT27638.1 DUF2934 domain-containing protein [Pseudomonas helleri]MQT81693.1 DUF2934 domain-containing protein [Pseudomonas helleri]MQU18583.1 DUF2934 domain-containing protein [Pseudomonas helleri]MQU28380.1 DUF2934 domain-containing protein [Pseudomonas helleri]
MSTNEKRIREFAYQIWESEGQPHGQEARHWEMAHKLAQAEALAPTKAETAKAAKAPAKSAAAKPATKEAAVKKPRAPRKPATP